MKSISIRQVKQKISNVLGEIGDGPVALTRYGRPVAIIMTPGEYEDFVALRSAARTDLFGHLIEAMGRGEALGAGARRLLNALRRSAASR